METVGERAEKGKPWERSCPEGGDFLKVLLGLQGACTGGACPWGVWTTGLACRTSEQLLRGPC